MAPSPQRPSAQEITETVLEAMRKGTEAFDQDAFLVPVHYEVFLHPDALKELTPMLPYLKERIRGRLDKQLNIMNARHAENQWGKIKGWVGGVLRKKGEDATADPIKQVYQRAMGNWVIEINPSYDADIALNYIGVKASLHKDRIIPRNIDPMQPTRNLTQALANAIPKTQPAQVPQAAQTPRTMAILAYQDHAGVQQYAMQKQEIVIGRYDTQAVMADVMLHTVAEVSREHCRIHFNPDSNTFFIKDCSKFGTLIGDHRIRPGHWETLPNGAVISLAGQIHLTFTIL